MSVCSRALILVMTWAVAFSAGCRKSVSPATSLGPLSAEERQFSAEERQAVDLAHAFLAKEGVDWGEPTRVRLVQVEYIPGWKGEGYFEVTYPTPADEIKILGDRAVVVELKSGKVAFVPRC